MNWFTTKVVFVSVIVYLVLVLLVPSGECLRRYHNIRKRWSFDPLVSYFDERHGPGARSFMIHKGDWWAYPINTLIPGLNLTYAPRMVKGWISHYPIQIPTLPLIIIYILTSLIHQPWINPFIPTPVPWLLLMGIWPYRFNKLLPYDDYYHFPIQIFSHMKDTPGPVGYFFGPIAGFWLDQWGKGWWGGVITHRSNWIKGTWRVTMDIKVTPDYRLPENPVTWKNKPWLAWHVLPFSHFEYHRYFRLQACTVFDWYFKVLIDGWIPMQFSHLTKHIRYTNCYCVLVYKRHIPFAMGAVLSYRNVLTSASITEILLTKYRRRYSLINLLGMWYFSDVYNFWCFINHRITNNSYYATPARIVYHNLWSPPEFLNRSHPLPVMHDLALWTTTYRLLYEFLTIIDLFTFEGHGVKAQLCHRFSYAKNTLWAFIGMWPVPPNYFMPTDPLYVVSCMMVMDQGRIPYPWFRYQYLTTKEDLYENCPMGKWGWFYCMNMRGPVAKLGVEAGTPLHVGWHLSNWWGLAGMASINIRLRSKKLMTLFTVLDTHVVLAWLYDAFLGRSPIQFLDVRYRNRIDWPLDFEDWAKGAELQPIIAEYMWYPPFPLKRMWPHQAPWFWYYHYKSLPMERDFLYDVMTF